MKLLTLSMPLAIEFMISLGNLIMNGKKMSRRFHVLKSQLSVVPGFSDVRKGKHLDFFGEAIGRFPRIDDP